MFLFVLDVGSAVRLTALETKKASAELLFAQKDTFGSVPVNLDVTDIISEQKNSLKAAGSAVFENIVPVTQNVLTAVGTANVRFFSQLGDAGNILGGNLYNLGAAAGEVTSKLLSRYNPSVTPLATVCHSMSNERRVILRYPFCRIYDFNCCFHFD
jgi:hypothetical protein